MTPALFRPGTSDRAIWHDVVELDEYRLPQMTAQDVCLDIGGQTGAATYAMLQKGAGKVIAFEPDPDNYILFRKQMKHEIKDGRVEVHPLAVVGGSGFSWRMLSGPLNENGEINFGGSFLFGKDGSDHGLRERVVNKPIKVVCIGIHEVLKLAPLPFLAKLDAEHSEFEIVDSLWAANHESPKHLVGEYHPTADKPVSRFEESLRSAHYEYTLQPHPNSELGLFFATRL